jgi:hypothetical protein
MPFSDGAFRKTPCSRRRSLSRRDFRQQPSVSTLGFAVETLPSPEGTEEALPAASFAPDGARKCFGAVNPALKRWAILMVSLRDNHDPIASLMQPWGARGEGRGVRGEGRRFVPSTLDTRPSTLAPRHSTLDTRPSTLDTRHSPLDTRRLWSNARASQTTRGQAGRFQRAARGPNPG